MYTDFVPKFVKQYAHMDKEIDAAVKGYISEVQEGIFPSEKHTFKINEEVLGKLY
jgi:3-methyl-2-oxobutanoate hydroxymethyltransferase